MKTDDYLTIHCKADGNREKTVKIAPIVSNNTLLNLGTGVAPGLAVDAHTNSMYLYPDVIAIDFTNVPYEKMPAPTYHNHPVAPSVDKLDPYYGGWPAIYPSDLEDPAPLEKRTGRDYMTRTPDAPLYQPKAQPPIK
jgi:hypothetical protein